MSKRKLLQLVQEGDVTGWDDPRMPTVSGLRRRGYTPESIRNFADKIGIARRENVIDVSLLEFCVREDLNDKTARMMAVIDPIKVVIDNYPDEKTDLMDIAYHQNNEDMGSRKVPFTKELYIERGDYMEDAPKKFFRLTEGREVRLRGAFIIKCESVEKDADGNVALIHCTYDEDSRSGSGSEASKRKVKGTIHWVSARESLDAEVRIYDRLFNDDAPDGHKDVDFKEFINPDSLKVLRNCKIEPALKDVKPLDSFQFTRLGYFCVDKDSTPENIIFNRTVSLKDSWAKAKK
jgi:glutaminyl-tRNA synthetase